MKKVDALSVFIASLLFLNCGAFAQTLPSPADASFKVAVVQPSPGAATLGRYGEFPVSLNNGLVNISIPVYEINTGKLSLPISLTYHPGGVRAYDLASSVGLGWSLNAGGSITRAIMGKPDESPVGALKNPFPNMASPGEQFSCFISLLTRPFAAFDGQMDKFYYNLGGSNGKFMFKNIKATGTPWDIVTIPYSAVKITVSPDFQSFTIIDLDGTTYVFGQVETTRVDADGYFFSDGPTTWHLTSIISADKSDTISFTYTTPIPVRTVQQSNTLTERDDYMYGLNTSESTSATVNVTQSVNLNEILFKNGKVSFLYGSRQDVSGQKLIAIKIFQKNNGQDTEIKRFNLTQSYFTAVVGQRSQVADASSVFDKRLRLDNVQEQGLINGTPSTGKPAYAFEYETSAFPLYGTTAQDIFGFYNGKHSNKNLLFYGVGDTDDGPKLGMEFGADRSVVPASMKAGQLKKITFPTGGFTEFEFEPNQISYTQTSTKPNYIYFPHGLTSHDRTITEKQIDVTSMKTGGAPFVIAQLKINFINNRLDAPKISSTIKVIDVTTGSYAKFVDTDTDVVIDLSVTTPFLNQTRDVKLLLNHTYKLTYDESTMPAQTANFLYAEVNWALFTNMATSTVNKTDYTGGLRIKSIVSNDGNGATTRKKYAYTKSYYNSNLFNGDIGRMAYFFRTRTRRYWSSQGMSPRELRWFNVYGENMTFQIGSSSNNALSYERVEEYTVDDQDNPLGKTEYTYNRAQDGIPSLAPFFRTDEEWKRGQLAAQRMYKSMPGGKFVLLKEIINLYDYTQMEAVKSYYASLEQDFNNPGTMVTTFKECTETLVNNVYKWMDFDQYVYRSNLISTTTIQYDENGLNPQSTQAQFVYDAGKHKQLIRSTQQTSKPEILVTDLKYPFDYAVGSCDETACLMNFDNTMNTLQTDKNNCEAQYYDQYRSYKAQAASIANPYHQQYDACMDGCGGWLACFSGCYNDRESGLEASQYHETLALADAAFSNYMNCRSNYQTAVTQNAVPALNSCKTSYNNCVTAILNGSSPMKDKALLIMQRDNIVNEVIEATSGFSLAGTEYITSGTKTDFKVLANSVIRPETIWKFNSSSPVVKTTFNQTPANYYQKFGSYFQYDNANNVIEKAKEQDVPSSFIWDYNKQYPIAEVINAKPEDIAYTSFESDGSGNFTISDLARNATDFRTGKRSYNLTNGNVWKSGLITGRKYTVSLWAKSGTVSVNGTSLSPASPKIINGWQYFEMTLTGSPSVTSATLSGSALIDELRFYPSDSRITTYTFDPLIGMTSTTDTNNLTTYYEYDALKRLSLVRDSDWNIIKRISYTFKLD